ncbi:pantoate--beta-alanine ligase [Corynebacterium lizhenjunii]|uniref:pantoate--beta-alanine ligase (AMP-forming) n=1 Tax=Corynebacterium lizhenjunii TaxID=2709394 RepID=A0A7T0KEV3_9CORY|nr:pantoate--beta-alanine ligase [Corynebacterium lizhenjunii]QPK79506.1 pantoate--beta-alanine ligase [Corynebacterium lizhenjunii]
MSVEVVHDVERMRMISSAYRKLGKPVHVVPLGAGIHAGHLSMLHAAGRTPGAVVVATVDAPLDTPPQGADVVFVVPRVAGSTRVVPEPGLEPDLTADLTHILRVVNLVSPTGVFVGEKDYELLKALHVACRDLGLAVRVFGVPTVRMPDGVAMSLRNARVSPDARPQATALSAALTAGAHAGVDAARAVLEAAGVEPEYVEVRDGRLMVAANIGGVRLIDNAAIDPEQYPSLAD